MVLQNGFIALHRSLLSWGWHDDPATFCLFVNLILMANHYPAEWKGITIDRGQLVTGRKALSDQTGLSERQIRTALDHLKSTGEVTIESTNKYSLITIVNYRKFQDIPETSTSKMTSTLTNDRPATDQQPTTKKQEEQCNKNKQDIERVRAKRFTPPTVEEVKAYCTEIGSGIDAEHFVDFYTANGWRVGKNPMRDWRATVRNWAKREGSFQAAPRASDVQKGFRPVPTQEEYLEGLDPSGFGWA